MGSNQDHGCNTGLSLDLLGFNTTINSNNGFKKLDKPASSMKFDHVYPALSLGPVLDQGFSVSPGSSSYSNNYSNSVKRSLDHEKEAGGICHGEEVEVDKVSSRASDEEEEEELEEEEASPRKKLRLNKDQSAVLEDSFKEHSTLNPHQKQALAKRLNLRPRQVEVWFQNRRARTKLKQTEMECEVMKKCCERLTEENKRLQKEVHDLKTLRLATPVYMQAVPSPTLSMCPSCERFIPTSAPVVVDQRHHHITATSIGAGPATAAFPNINGTKLPGFFTHPSAAC